MSIKPPVAVSVSRGTKGQPGRYGRRPDRDTSYSPEIKAAALELHARGVPVARIAAFFVAPYFTVYAWIRRQRKA